MNPNQVLSLRVNTRLLRENADVVRILDRLVEDQIITNVSEMQMINFPLLGNCSFHNTNKLSQDWNPCESWLLTTATIFAVILLAGLGPIIRN